MLTKGGAGFHMHLFLADASPHLELFLVNGALSLEIVPAWETSFLGFYAEQLISPFLSGTWQTLQEVLSRGLQWQQGQL